MDLLKQQNKARLPAQITIYGALSLALVLSLVCVCVRSASQAVLLAEADAAARLSVESVFAGYCRELLEEFDIFALRYPGSADRRLWQYADENIKGINTMQKVSLAGAEFEQCVSMADQGGIGLEKQILAYMDYGIYSQIIAEIAGIEETGKRSRAVQEITQEIEECEKKLAETETLIMELVELVEGLKTEPDGLYIKKGKPVANGSYFAKAAITQTVSMEAAAIDSVSVYEAAAGSYTKYTNVMQILDDMAVDTQELENIGDEASESYGANSCAELYKRNYSSLKEVISKVAEKTQEAVKKIESYKKGRNQCAGNFDICIEKVEQNKKVLGEDLYASLSDDLMQMKEGEANSKNALCDVETIQEGLMHNQKILEAMQNILPELDIDLKAENCGTVRKNLDYCKELLGGLSNGKLKFDYSKIDFSQESQGTGIIVNIRKTLSEGIAGLVAPEQISDNAIHYADLSSGIYGNSQDNSEWQNAKDRLLFGQYLLGRLDSYTDAQETQENPWCGLAYPLEYILYGNCSDKENLNEAILNLSILREGSNLIYLITDSEKRSEAYTLASALVGFTGNAAVIKAAQYLILGVWAYGESILDIKTLLSGGNVPVAKTKETWQLGLNRLLKMDLSVEKQEKSEKKAGEMSYRDYLGLFLLAMDKGKMIYRTMDIMELRMMSLGKENFRMYDYIWQAIGTVTVQAEWMDAYYIREIQYQYV